MLKTKIHIGKMFAVSRRNLQKTIWHPQVNSVILLSMKQEIILYREYRPRRKWNTQRKKKNELNNSYNELKMQIQTKYLNQR